MAKDKSRPDYSNWIPMKLIITLWIATAVFIIMTILSFSLGWHTAVSVVLLIVSIPLFAETLYMTIVRNEFSFEGGKLMRKIHEYLSSKLDWNGEGKALDVGCGSGALSILLAKKYPEAKVVGTDYWGAVWNYAEDQCNENARLEGVSNTEFVKGDARKLDYPDETFDVVVSNFVYHEVRTEPDKRKLLRESLRVLKKGGAFAFHDLMEEKKWYGDMEEFCEELRKAGFEEVHYEPHTEKLPWIPGYVRTKAMFYSLGLLYGKK